MSVNLEYYKIFYYVGRLGGITLAAEELSITQPAVSQAVRSLERALGTKLFVRTGKGVHLTPAGEVLYAYVRRGYEEIQTGERKIREICLISSTGKYAFFRDGPAEFMRHKAGLFQI